MNRFIKYLQRMFRLYKPGKEYWIDLDDIIVPAEFKKTRISPAKWKHKLDYWKKNGTFESRIRINRDFVLVDGFSSAKIAYLYGISKVPVYFVD